MIFRDNLTEPVEFFQVEVMSSDRAFIKDTVATIAIADISENSTFFSLDMESYNVREGELVSVCVESLSDLSTLLRNATFQLQTSDISAKGIYIKWG